MTRRLHVAGRIWTMDEGRPYVRRMAVEAGRVLAFGTNTKITGLSLPAALASLRSVVFDVDVDGDGKPDVSYYGDHWGGSVTKLGAPSRYMGRGRAARCVHGLELKVPASALPIGDHGLRVRMTILNREPQQAAWVAIGQASSAG